MPLKAEQIYNAMKDAGYKMESRDANDFYERLKADPSKATDVYTALLNDGYKLESKNADDFSERLGLKKKEAPADGGFLSVDWLIKNTPGYYSPSPSEPVLTEQAKRGLKLNPFFSTPTLDRPDLIGKKQEQVMGGEVATAEEGKTLQRFLASPTIEEFDDDHKKDVLDMVFAGKETELNIAGKLDDTAKNKLTRERNEFSQRFYNGELSGDDIEAIKQSNPIAFPKQYDTIPSPVVAQGINNKTKQLASWAKGVNENGAANYTLTKDELESQKNARQQALDDLVGTNYIKKVGDSYVAAVPEKQYIADQANGLQAQIDDTDLKLSYVKKDFDTNQYKPLEQKVFDRNILGEISSMYAGMRPEDIYKYEGGMRMSADDSMSDEQMAAMKKLHADPNFKLGDIIKYDETNHLTPESVVKLRGLVTNIVNRDKNPIIEAHEHGTVGRKTRTGNTGGVDAGGIAQDVSAATETALPIDPQDLIAKTINYFNYELPAKVLAEGYANKWKNSAVGQQVAPFLDAQKQINSNNKEITKFESAIKTSLDAGYLSINDKYNKIFSVNPEFTKTVADWKSRVDKGLISPEQGEVELMNSVKNNPTLKEILAQKDNEVDKLRNTANAQRERYLIEAGGKVNPNLEIDANGRLTVKGMTRDQLDAAMQDFQKGYEQEVSNTYKGQEAFLANKADFINKGMQETFGRFGGAFMVGVTGAVDDLGAATARWLYHKTGLAGDAMNYFEGERQRPLNAGEYAENHYKYKGLESLMDPAYYGFSSGQSFPYAAPGLVLGVATGGTTAGIAFSSIAGAGLETVENALLTRNELFTEGKDKDGLKITSQDADRIAAQQFRDELVPNIAFQALELGALMRTAKYVKPSFNLKSVGKGLLDTGEAGLAEAAQEGVQGYVQAAAKQRATEGTKLDMFDYLQTDDFVQNFFGGFAGGITMGGGVKPLAYANSIRNWQAMIKESQKAFNNNARNDFAGDVPYANALHAELNGTGAEFRDGIKLRLQNEQFKDNGEKENLKRALTYSDRLAKSIKREGVSPENINELYAAHSVAMADMYESLSETDKESSQGKLYAQQAKTFRQQSVDALNGEAKAYYVIDKEGRPIFMSEKTANTMGAAKSFENMKRNGQITAVGAVNDDVFNTNIADVANATPTIVKAAPAENPFDTRWKENIRAIGERTDLTEAQKESLKQFEDKRHADEMAAQNSADLFERTKASAGEMLRRTLDGAEAVNDKAGGLKMMTDQAMSAPAGTLAQFNNNEELVTDLIAQNGKEAIEAKIKEQNDLLAGEVTNDVELKTIDRNVELLQKGLDKVAAPVEQVAASNVSAEPVVTPSPAENVAPSVAVTPSTKYVSSLDGTGATISNVDGNNVTVTFDGQQESEVMTAQDFAELFKPVDEQAVAQQREALRPTIDVSVDEVSDGDIVKSKDRLALKSRKDAIKADIDVLKKIILCIYG